MTLSAPTAVAFAISGGAPTDVREWVTIDLAGRPSSHRRGYAVMTESLLPSGRGEEFARHARALILQELRRYQQHPADMALARAFAVANSFIYESGRMQGMVGQQFLIGASAIVFEEHTAVFAHVPPGQIALAQDGLFYAIPELASWLPLFAEPVDEAPTPEPLGFASWTSPILVRTELREGDTIILCNAQVGRSLAAASVDETMDQFSITKLHGRDPDLVMDTIRDIVIEREDAVAAVAVISFPPADRGSGIETVADIGRNAREQWRHGRAAVRQLLPARPASPKVKPVGTAVSAPPPESVPGEDVVQAPAPPRQVRGAGLQERLIQLTERRSGGWRDTWRQPSDLRQLGAPGAHGISRYRDSSLGADETGWRTAMPRLPFLRSPFFIGFCLLVIVGIGLTLYVQRDAFLPTEEDYIGYIADVDRRLLLVRDMTDDQAIMDELGRAEQELTEAKQAGAPDDLLRPREKQIVLERDELQHVIRLDDVTRVGSLPEELQTSETRAIHTPGGIFLANGNLYRLRPESREMVIVLQSGTDVEGLTVGNLFGVAYDGDLLVTTDGQHVFFAGSADGAAWQSMSMDEINEQGPWPPGPVAAFGQNLYLLVADYRNIYQFVLDPAEETAAPIDWVLTGDRVNFNLAVDLTIDGNIYVLLENGQVLTMLRGAQKAVFDIPTFNPETETPLAIVGGPMTGYLYVAVVDDEGHGRVIAMDREGGHMSQLALPDGLSTGDTDVLPPFDDLQDIGVDEDSGTLYLINGDAVWTARFTLPALPQPEATPEASPESAE